MTEWLLYLLGGRTEDTVRMVEADLAFRGTGHMGWFVALLALAAWVTYRLYKRSPATLPASRLYVLAGLRVLFFALLLVLLLRPVLSLTIEGSVRRLLVMLVDGSSSMQIQDPRLEEADRNRAALALGALDAKGGLKQQPADDPDFRSVSRLRLVQAALQNDQLDLLPRLDREFDLSAFRFGQGLAELSARAVPNATNDSALTADSFDWVNDLSAEGTVTAIGDALREMMNRKRGQPLAGVLLISDGANNSGTPPREVASLLRQEGVPLYIYGVGITSPRDIIVGSLFAPDVSFLDDELAVTVRVRTQGLEGEEGELQLKLDDEVVARQTLRFGPDGEQAVPLLFTPLAEGEFDLSAEIAARPDEAVTDNNRRAQRLKVVDQKIKVLLVDQSPRWEFRYLQAMLLRDRRVELKCVLVEGDPEIARDADAPYLERMPARREELFEYDLIVYGDVDPRAVSATQLEYLGEWVSRFGGALVVVAGKRHVPHAYRRGIMDKLLPVEYEGSGLELTQDPVADEAIQLELTAAGKASPMLRLSDRPEESAALWKELPPVYWVAKVSRPKPAAEVLLVDPDPSKESRFGKMPVLAVQQYGLGQVMYVGTDNTWRWRKNAGDLYYTTLWGQIAQRITLQRLLGVSKLTQLTSERQNYLSGDRVTLYARLYTTGYEPIQQPAVQGLYRSKSNGGPRSQVTLRPLPEQPGLYRGEFIAPGAGAYQFLVDHDPDSPLDFNVTEPRFEFGETAMNEPLLREIAAVSAGAFFREEDLHLLPDTISRRTERVRSPLELELWCSPLYFLLLLGVLTAEWLLRKWSHLK